MLVMGANTKICVYCGIDLAGELMTYNRARFICKPAAYNVLHRTVTLEYVKLAAHACKRRGAMFGQALKKRMRGKMSDGVGKKSNAAKCNLFTACFKAALDTLVRP